ncbi:hypothetical protein [Anaerotignum neopropionicum]|uniref:hypothetical protein n=1 Tax=Anaerotignum neopropionicum TaxID=36847 RepID=UPI00138F7C6C|nr:hypothetical protein [Anaerotignum neopropionicum]
MTEKQKRFADEYLIDLIALVRDNQNRYNRQRYYKKCRIFKAIREYGANQFYCHICGENDNVVRQ